MKKYFFYLILLLFVLQIFATVIWYYCPEKLLFLKYKTISPLKIEDIKKPVLFLTTHEDVQKDCAIMCGECNKANTKINILAKYFYFSLQNIPLVTSYNKILVKDKPNNLTEKCINLIKKNQSIMMMLHSNNKKKGLYYILKATKIPIVFCRMKQKNHREVTLEYEMYKDYDITLDRDEFVEMITKKLYQNL